VQQSSDQNSIIVSHVLKNDPKIESVRFPEHTNKKREREREIKRKKRKGDKKRRRRVNRRKSQVALFLPRVCERDMCKPLM
jgi:hypothetical protein